MKAKMGLYHGICLSTILKFDWLMIQAIQWITMMTKIVVVSDFHKGCSMDYADS